jgi:hypothetical protein
MSVTRCAAGRSAEGASYLTVRLETPFGVLYRSLLMDQFLAARRHDHQIVVHLAPLTSLDWLATKIDVEAERSSTGKGTLKGTVIDSPGEISSTPVAYVYV